MSPFLRLAGFVGLVLTIAVTGCSQESKLRARCASGDVTTCAQLADAYASGRGVERNMGRAAEYSERACTGGIADVCNTLGEIYEKSDVEGGPTRAAQYFQKACDGHSSAGCLNLGIFYSDKGDWTKAMALFEQSCSGGWAPGCHQLGQTYEQGEGVTKNMTKAVTFYTQACDLEHVVSCVTLGTHYWTGELVTKDPTNALKFFGKAHAIYDESCKAGNETDCPERDRLRTRMTLIANTPPAATPPLPGQPGATPIK